MASQRQLSLTMWGSEICKCTDASTWNTHARAYNKAHPCQTVQPNEHNQYGSTNYVPVCSPAPDDVTVDEFNWVITKQNCDNPCHYPSVEAFNAAKSSRDDNWRPWTQAEFDAGREAQGNCSRTDEQIAEMTENEKARLKWASESMVCQFWEGGVDAYNRFRTLRGYRPVTKREYVELIAAYCGVKRDLNDKQKAVFAKMQAASMPEDLIFRALAQMNTQALDEFLSRPDVSVPPSVDLGSGPTYQPRGTGRGLSIPDMSGSGVRRGVRRSATTVADVLAKLKANVPLTPEDQTVLSAEKECLDSAGIWENGSCVKKKSLPPLVAYSAFEQYKVPIYVAIAAGGALLLWSLLKPKSKKKSKGRKALR